MTTFVTLTISGIGLAALLFMVAAGLSLIFGLMGVLNFAHGSFFLWGAYIFVAAYTRTGVFWVALLAAFAAGALLGLLTERIFMRTLYQRPLSQILVTLGLGLVLNQAVIAIWGQVPEYVDVSGLGGKFQVGDAYVTHYTVFSIVLGLVVLTLVWMLLRFTRIGLIVRAGVENPVMVRALGINVGLVFLAVFTLGSALAALGGAVYTPNFSATTDMGQTVLLNAIIVVVLGGLGSFLGSALGALIIGLAQDYVPYYLSQVAASHPQLVNYQGSAASLASLVLLIAILLFRPQGLLGIELEGGAL